VIKVHEQMGETRPSISTGLEIKQGKNLPFIIY